VIVYRLIDTLDKTSSTINAEYHLMKAELEVKHKKSGILRKTSFNYLLTQSIAKNEFFSPIVNCNYFSIDGPGKTFQSVKRGCIIPHDQQTFAVMVQDKQQTFGP